MMNKVESYSKSLIQSCSKTKFLKRATLVMQKNLQSASSSAYSPSSVQRSSCNSLKQSASDSMKLFHRMNIALFAFVMVGSFYLIYLKDIQGTFINKPISFSMDTSSLKTDKSVYQTGDTVYLYFSYCKHYDYSNVSTWNLVDSIVRPFPAKTYNVPAGCAAGWYPVVTIPTDDAFIGDGIYHLEGESDIAVNPLKTVVIHYKSQSFHIQPNVRAIITK